MQYLSTAMVETIGAGTASYKTRLELTDDDLYARVNINFSKIFKEIHLDQRLFLNHILITVICFRYS